MQTTHIEVAVKDGMRAGRDAYLAKLESSGLPAVRAKISEFKGRKGFARYCSQFGADVDAAKASPERTSRARTQRVEAAQNGAESEVQKLERMLREAKEREATASAPTTRTSPTGPQIKLIERIAHRKGDSVEVTVKLNGKTMTFEQGSAYIDAGLAAGVIKFRNK